MGGKCHPVEGTDGLAVQHMAHDGLFFYKLKGGVHWSKQRLKIVEMEMPEDGIDIYTL